MPATGAGARRGGAMEGSGLVGDLWSTPPTHLVTGGADGRPWQWRSTTGASGTAAISPFEVLLEGDLPDGVHTLTVVQRNEVALRPRTETTARTFVIDRTPPAALTLSAPASASEGTPVGVAWAGLEADAITTWSVVAGDGAGALVRGPERTAAGGVILTGLPAGAYEVRAAQRDRAGNDGPVAAVGIRIVASAAPPPAAPAAAGTATPAPALRLPTRNAARLRPARSATVRTRRPILRWPRGPRDTTLDNVQVFRVRAGTGAAARPAAVFRKVSSAFPRGTRHRTRLLARGACYAWRVRPYRGGAFTRQPLGISHFCVARAAADRAPAAA